MSIGKGYVDLELVSDDAIFHDDEGAEHVVEWVTQPSPGSRDPSDEIRDATGRVPNLAFGDADEATRLGPRFHVEVYVAPEVAEHGSPPPWPRAGVVDDSDAPSLTVIADQDGNQGIVCLDGSAAKKDSKRQLTGGARLQRDKVPHG